MRASRPVSGFTVLNAQRRWNSGATRGPSGPTSSASPSKPKTAASKIDVLLPADKPIKLPRDRRFQEETGALFQTALSHRLLRSKSKSKGKAGGTEGEATDEHPSLEDGTSLREDRYGWPDELRTTREAPLWMVYEAEREERMLPDLLVDNMDMHWFGV
jgi:hypothetical protein